MASINNSFPAFILSLLLASGVQGVDVGPKANNFGLPSCTTTNGNGNSYRTYEILCDKQLDQTTPFASNALTNTVTKNSAVSFSKTCALIDAGPFTVSKGPEIDLDSILALGVDRHTIFAPTDAAWDNIGPIYSTIMAMQLTDKVMFDNMVSQILQLHILPGTYLLDDLICDCVYEAYNLSGLSENTQYSKTKCRGAVSTPYQIGGGNTMSDVQPAIGSPISTFSASEFTFQATGSNFAYPRTITGQFASNVVGCNGVIHVVDNVLLPGDLAFDSADGVRSGPSSGDKSGKVDGKATKSAKKGSSRNLSPGKVAGDEASRTEELERRRHRLEAMLEPSGDVQPLN